MPRLERYGRRTHHGEGADDDVAGFRRTSAKNSWSPPSSQSHRRTRRDSPDLEQECHPGPVKSRVVNSDCSASGDRRHNGYTLSGGGPALIAARVIADRSAISKNGWVHARTPVVQALQHYEAFRISGFLLAIRQPALYPNVSAGPRLNSSPPIVTAHSARDNGIGHYVSRWMKSAPEPTSASGADCVEKLRNRGAPKISQMSHVGDFCRCKAL